MQENSPMRKRTRSASGSLALNTSRLSSCPEQKRARKSMSFLPDTPMSTHGMKAMTRRRVNPDSLASRLGPELVKVLNALLKPGMTEMPSFRVRQEVQKRFNVDRRHIYDYFHSLGLRVNKEDKKCASENDSPTVGAHILRKIRQCPTPGPMLLPARNFGRDVADMWPYNPGASSASPDCFRYSDTPFQVSQPYYPSYYVVNPLYTVPVDAHYAQAIPTSVSPSLSSDSWSVCVQNTPHTAPVNYTNALLDPHKTQPSPTTDNASFPASLKKVPRYQIGTLMPLYGHSPLEQPEREACYQFLQDVIGPAHGIQESVGTYKAHMAKQTRAHFRRLVGDLAPSQPSTPDLTSARPLSSRADSACAVSPVPGDSGNGPSGLVAQGLSGQVETQTDEFWKWLRTPRPVSPSMTSSRAHTPSMMSGTPSTVSEAESWLSETEDRLEYPCLAISDVLHSHVLNENDESLPMTFEISPTDDPKIQPGKYKRNTEHNEERCYHSADDLDGGRSSLHSCATEMPNGGPGIFSCSVLSSPEFDTGGALALENANIPDNKETIPRKCGPPGPRLTRARNISAGGGI